MASPPQETTYSTPDPSGDTEMTPSHAPISEPFDVPPLRMIPFGGKEPVPFSKETTYSSSDPSSDTEMTPPHAPISEPFDVPPQRMIPFGGKEPVPFSKQELERFREHKLLASSRERGPHEDPIPHKLESHAFYVKGDWKAFVQIRSDGHKDWTYAHKGYRRKFRSLREVEMFLTYTKGKTDIFNGRRLQRMKTEDPEGHGPGASKSTGGRKALKSSSATIVLNCPNHQISPEVPPGFL